MSSLLHFSPAKPPQNPSISPSQSKWSGLRKLLPRHPPHPITRNLISKPPLLIFSNLKEPPFPLFHHHPTPLSNNSSFSTVTYAGRSKKKPGGPSPGRIEGSGELRRVAKENARRRSRRIAENRFFRRSRSAAEQADSFTEDELEMIGLGYDRAVRFMSKDHPMLRHPHDWYKYGRYGPYSWRGIVVGPPIRGRFTDERVSIIGEVRDHEEFEKIEQFEMANDYSRHVLDLNPSVGRRLYWVFVRHPKWRSSELPWQQWTLVSEVAVEAGEKDWIDKWSLMGRLGNRSRAYVTQCAAWMRPDIIYVKKPLYQCRFEPQDEFFKQLWPLLDPNTENQFKFELRREEKGRVFVEDCTYFGGLCKIVKISSKAYVDDVVNAYQKLSEEGKSQCLEFLLRNHPVELLHPYTKEWKAKLEEMELGCDAPDESDDDGGGNEEEEIAEWIEDDDSGGDYEDDEEEGEEDYVFEASGGYDEVIDAGEEEEDNDEEERIDPEETREYWDEQWEKALRSSQTMEEMVKKRLDASEKSYKRKMEEASMKEDENYESIQSNVNAELEQIKAEWKKEEFKWAKRKVKKGKLPPELFLKSAVRPFTYRNLVKEIVLMRHAIIDGDISLKT
ncbi:uncharacterized protein LOC110030850 isoform X2 [Phalaenopsis equestris]|uniref:uncharacterized protein LOC110030850 isoform X1 n=1 Tax=Phalaenopsis equestris TaxID=78828 RepID=UPI0009E39808|nr:uncharacterized protein LOC110030850 isoform X1 [Phalaenopsis equestris]XP_020589451.1 uncharacterized protein LOC110030850 isoform X2 [Phalaenopsis equestris]